MRVLKDVRFTSVSLIKEEQMLDPSKMLFTVKSENDDAFEALKKCHGISVGGTASVMSLPTFWERILRWIRGFWAKVKFRLKCWLVKDV